MDTDDMSKPKSNKNVQIPDVILKQLLTDSEMRMLKNRFLILNLLKKGLSIRAVASQVKVGTDTVVRVARMIKDGQLKNYKSAKRVTFKTSTPWIFGKNQ